MRKDQVLKALQILYENNCRAKIELAEICHQL